MAVTKVLVVGSGKLSSGQRKPRIRIAGFWLEELGFEENVLVAAEFAQGKAILTAKGVGIEAYNNCVKDIRQKNGRLIQVRNDLHNKKRTPHFEMAALWLEDYGFHIGDVVVLRCDYGVITITRLEI